MRRALWIILAVALAAVISISVVLVVQAAGGDDDSMIDIDLTSDGDNSDGEGEKVSSSSYFTVSGMVPGDSVAMLYSIKSDAGGATLEISFEYGENTALAAFLELSVTAEGDTLYDGALMGVMGNALETTVSGTTVVEMTYTMPLDTGNEAKGQLLDVEINFAISE